jgi:hypothetical protein
VEARLSQVLYLYLYLVVFAPAKHQNVEFYTMGGYLGVAGNMTLTTSTFALFLKRFQILYSRRLLEFRPRIGGDDFVLLLIGERSELVSIQLEIVSDLEKYVGKVKSPTFAWMPVLPFEDLEVGVYCKKSVVVNMEISPLTEAKNYTIKSQFGLPVLETLLDQERFHYKPSEEEEQFRKYVSSVRAETKNLQSQDEAETLMRYLYASQSKVNPWRDSRRVLKQVSLCDYHQIGSFYVTQKVWLSVADVSEIHDSASKRYRYTPLTKLLYLLTRSFAQIVTCLEGVMEVSLVVCKSELRVFKGSRTDLVYVPSSVVTQEEVQCLDELLHEMGGAWRISI